MKTTTGKSCWLLWSAILLAGAGCVAPHYREHQLILFGKSPPFITDPYDPAIAQNLSAKPWPKSPFGPELGVGVVPFKSIGIQGWHDYHMIAKARGPVVLRQISSSGFLTVDLRLDSLKLDDVPVPITNPRYMRLEIYLPRVLVEDSIRRETNEVLTVEGKLAWDCDGWFEIHPQKSGDVLRE